LWIEVLAEQARLRRAGPAGAGAEVLVEQVPVEVALEVARAHKRRRLDDLVVDDDEEVRPMVDAGRPGERPL
jgi:hypothetical protein